eukprot:COSAG06_NODE_44816_length_360_cov_0.781609_1_plen_28_part_01
MGRECFLGESCLEIALVQSKVEELEVLH